MTTTSPPPLHRTEVDGVPVLWREVPGPLTAGLVLGVGRRDEGYVDGGVTHLLEHLVMHDAAPRRLEANASVGLSTTELTVTGRPDQVVTFLRRACELLADPPVERLAVEASVLAAEARGKGGDVAGLLLGERYGVGGLGVVALAEVALTSITAEQVRRWAAERAVTGAAAVWLTGAPPEDLALPLPVGPRPPAPPAEEPDGPFPSWLPVPGAPLVLAGTVTTGAAGAVLMGVLEARLEEELRHRRGLTYEVEGVSARVDEEVRHVRVATEVAEGQELTALRVVRDAVAALARSGPTEAELAEERGSVEEMVLDPRSVPGELSSVAEQLVRGWTPRPAEQVLADVLAVTAEEVRREARALRRSALWVVPEGVEPEEPGLEQRPGWSPETVQGGTVFRRRLLRGVPRSARLVVGDDGLMLDVGDGMRRTVLWEDVLGVVDDRTPGGSTFQVVGARGFTVPLCPADWRGGEEALALVRARVPAALQVPADEPASPDEPWTPYA